MNYNKTAQELLLSLKLEDPNLQLVADLKTTKLEDLLYDLNTESIKKAFWINIYNAYFLLLRKYNGLAKPAIYKNKAITIAGVNLSLDDIEHGILRRFKYKYSLGYFNSPFVKDKIKKLAVHQLDFRIHFTLNCGAKSCPPIAFYTADNIDAELDLASKSFLTTDVEIDKVKKVISVSKLFRWYFADFGGRKGIREILNQYLDIESAGFKISFSEYNWEEDLNNFS